MQYALFYIDFFVNNIQKNHHLTALNGDFIIVCVTFLIMCFNRLSPFLRGRTGNSSQLTSMVSMPFIGLLPFLQKLCTTQNVEEFLLCQCPLSGFFHFYGFDGCIKFKTIHCVNALYRASSISTPGTSWYR